MCYTSYSYVTKFCLNRRDKHILCKCFARTFEGCAFVVTLGALKSSSSEELCVQKRYKRECMCDNYLFDKHRLTLHRHL